MGFDHAADKEKRRMVSTHFAIGFFDPLDHFLRDPQDPHIELIRSARDEMFRDIKGEATKHASVFPELFPVEPNLTLVVNSIEDEARAFAFDTGRSLENAAIPPVFLRDLIQLRVARAIPEWPQLQCRLQIRLDIARHARGKPAAVCRGDGGRCRFRSRFPEFPVCAAETEILAQETARRQSEEEKWAHGN